MQGIVGSGTGALAAMSMTGVGMCLAAVLILAENAAADLAHSSAGTQAAHVYAEARGRRRAERMETVEICILSAGGVFGVKQIRLSG